MYISYLRKKRKSDLTLNGSGALTIIGNYKHGIVSKDELVITGGTYDIHTVKDAINGKDCVKIKAGELTPNAVNGNGIQSKNEDDTTKGYVYIAGGMGGRGDIGGVKIPLKSI